MKRLRGLAPLLFPVCLGACRSQAKPTPSAPGSSEAPFLVDAAPGAPALVAPAPVALKSDAVFSAPIAAARVQGGAIVVAGLVADAGVVRVVGFRNGRPGWATDAIKGVVWTPNAELTLQPAADGVAVQWRGEHHDHEKVGLGGESLFVVIGPQGELRGAPISVGAGFCTTADGMAWIDPNRSSDTHVFARGFADVPHERVVVPRGRTTTLACADHNVYVLGDGDDDITVTAFVPGAATSPLPEVAARVADFTDEERDHQTFTVGDGLQLVRIGEHGQIATRDIAAGHVGPWRKLKQVLSADDDIVLADGSATSWMLVFTQDAEGACPAAGSLGQGVKALRVDRASGAESVIDLAAPDCVRSFGPFWMSLAPPSAAPADTSSFVAWVERAERPSSKSAPITGLAYRFIDHVSGAIRSGRVDVDTDALVQAGCDGERCLAAALVREPDDGDAMRPMAVTVLSYP